MRPVLPFPLSKPVRPRNKLGGFLVQSAQNEKPYKHREPSQRNRGNNLNRLIGTFWLIHFLFPPKEPGRERSRIPFALLQPTKVLHKSPTGLLCKINHLKKGGDHQPDRE